MSDIIQRTINIIKNASKYMKHNKFIKKILESYIFQD